MTVTLLTAVVVSVILTARSLPPREYTYQHTWAGRATLVAYVAFLGIGAAAGWAGWRAATAIGWQPTDSSFFRGVILGSFGQAIVRVHLKRIPNGSSEDAFTLLTVLNDLVAGILDESVAVAVTRGLERLEPEALAQHVSYMFYRFVAADERYPENTRKLFEARIAAGVSELLAGDDAARLRAQSLLLALAEDWTLRYHVLRPGA